MARSVGVRNPAQSNGTQSHMAGGTMGGRPQAMGRKPGSRPIALGDEFYLWILVLIEVTLIGILRRKFRRYHGG